MLRVDVVLAAVFRRLRAHARRRAVREADRHVPRRARNDVAVRVHQVRHIGRVRAFRYVVRVRQNRVALRVRPNHRKNLNPHRFLIRLVRIVRRVRVAVVNDRRRHRRGVFHDVFVRWHIRTAHHQLGFVLFAVVGDVVVFRQNREGLANVHRLRRVDVVIATFRADVAKTDVHRARRARNQITVRVVGAHHVGGVLLFQDAVRRHIHPIHHRKQLQRHRVFFTRRVVRRGLVENRRLYLVVGDYHTRKATARWIADRDGKVLAAFSQVIIVSVNRESCAG